MALHPTILHHFLTYPSAIPEALFQWRVDVERSNTTDITTGELLRDDSGQPVERFAGPAALTALSQLRCAVYEASVEDRVLWMQQGEQVEIMAYFPRYLTGALRGYLPDVRVGDRLVLPARVSGEPRRLTVRKVRDLEQAGLLLEVACTEQVPGDQRAYGY